MLSMFDHLVFGSLVLGALLLSTVAQSDLPPLGFVAQHGPIFGHEPPK